MSKPVFSDRREGPLQIVHDFHFTALNVKDDYSCLLTASHEEKLAAMKKRVDSLARKGYGGVVLNVDHADYFENERSFERVREIALYAKEKGMKVWLYDEQYYPSGSAGGHTLLGHPEFEAAALSCVTKRIAIHQGEGAIRVPAPLGHSSLQYAFAVPVADGREQFEKRLDVSGCRDLAGGLCFDAPVGEWQVYAFFVRVLYEATKLCQATRASRRYINIRSRAAVARFYEITFENGYNRLFDRLGNVVDAVFTDEPNTPLYISWKDGQPRTMFASFSKYDFSHNDIPVYPFVPWQQDVPERFREKYGYELASVLVDIFTETANTKKARVDFYTLLSDMALEAYPKQLQGKLSRLGVNLSGHYYGEEAFDVQPFYYGDILEHLAAMGIPGCDNLKSEANALRYCCACKLASSAAHLAGKERVMIEASNMVDADQNLTLKKAKAAVSMMFVHGVNLITSYYGENLFDEAGMQAFTRHISHLTTLFAGGRTVTDTFLYYPFEELCATLEPEGTVEIGDGFHDRFGVLKTAEKLMQSRVTFDFINARRLLACEIGNGFILAPNGNRIRTVVLPKTGFLFDPRLAAYLEKAMQNGIVVLTDGEDTAFDEISRDLTLETPDPFVTLLHKRFDGYDLYLLMNTSEKPFESNVSIPCQDGDRFCSVDPDTLETAEVFSEVREHRAVISVRFDALSPVILCRYR